MDDHANDQATANLIAERNPRVLLRALRDNGFYIYSIHKSDVDEYLQEQRHDPIEASVVEPVTNEDLRKVNRSFHGVDDIIPHSDVMQELVREIRITRTETNK